MGLCIIGAKDVKEYQIRKQALVIDLRDPKDYMRFHIEGAINVPAAELEQFMEKISKKQMLVFYCQHGSQSFQEGKKYVRRGYQICSLAGGVLAYRQTFRI